MMFDILRRKKPKGQRRYGMFTGRGPEEYIEHQFSAREKAIIKQQAVRKKLGYTPELMHFTKPGHADKFVIVEPVVQRFKKRQKPTRMILGRRL